MNLTVEQVQQLPKYTTIRVRRANAKRFALAVTTDVARLAGDGKWTLLPFAFAYRDGDEVVLKSGYHVAIVGGDYPDAIEVVEETTPAGETEMSAPDTSVAAITATVVRRTDRLVTVRVEGTYIQPKARVAAFEASGSREVVRIAQVQQPKGYYLPAWTVTLRAPEPTTSTGKTEAAIRAKGGIFVGRHGERFVTVETMDVMRRQYGTSTYGRSLVEVAQAIIDENDKPTARCESGWTGDRCTYALGHAGPHSN